MYTVELHLTIPSLAVLLQAPARLVEIWPIILYYTRVTFRNFVKELIK